MSITSGTHDVALLGGRDFPWLRQTTIRQTDLPVRNGPSLLAYDLVVGKTEVALYSFWSVSRFYARLKITIPQDTKSRKLNSSGVRFDVHRAAVEQLPSADLESLNALKWVAWTDVVIPDTLVKVFFRAFKVYWTIAKHAARFAWKLAASGTPGTGDAALRQAFYVLTPLIATWARMA